MAAFVIARSGFGMGIIKVAYGFASPPSQPFGGAGHELNFFSTNCKMFSDMLRLTGEFQLISLSVEHVPGIAQNADFQKIALPLRLSHLWRCT